MKAKKVVMMFKKRILNGAVLKKGTVVDNIKLGNMLSWAMLFGNIDWFIPELDMYVRGTCGKHCKGCFDKDNPRCSECYVTKSYYQHTNRNEDDTVGDIVTGKCTVKLGHAYRTLAMMHFRDELLDQLDKQLSKEKEYNVVRINESGELFSLEVLLFWIELAKRHPEFIMYLYTKNYDVVREVLNDYDIPSNLFINISIWHKYGIKEFLEFRWHPQIRAFAVVDNVWTKEKYLKSGVKIEAMCPAYDSKGKMNHNQTCAKCGICYHPLAQCTGCYKH